MIKYILIFVLLSSTVFANTGLIGGYSFRYDGYNQEGGVQVKANGNDGTAENFSAGDCNGSTDFVTVSANGNDTILSNASGLEWAVVGDDFTVGKDGASFYTGQLPWFISIVSANFTADQKAQILLDPKKALIYGADLWVWDYTIDNYINLRTSGDDVATNQGVSDTTTGGTPLYNLWKAGFKGFEFDGVNDYIVFDQITNDGNVTLYFVFEHTSDDGSDSLIGTASNGNNGLQVRLSGARLQLLKSTAVQIATSVSSFNLNQKYIIAVTYSLNGDYKIYIDSNLDKSGNSVQTFVWNTIALGSRGSSSALEPFQGFEFEALIYPTAHTARQIKHNTEVLKRWYP